MKDVLSDGPEVAGIYKRRMEPYEKYRMGNYKIQLVKVLMGNEGVIRELPAKSHNSTAWLDKMGYMEMYAVKVMNLAETFSIRIPQDYTMFLSLVDAFRRDSEAGNKAIEMFTETLCMIAQSFDGVMLEWILFACRVTLVTRGRNYTKAEKKKEYEKIYGEMKAWLKHSLAEYTAEDKTDLAENESKQDETADRLIHEELQ